ncbi:MAG TPA: hypothetical protein PLS94_03250 [Prolixibacteraceae bacterium]|nr:hypothetical protein [Prolixibacteraceae bacterium]HPR60766.1 hypothetical protein [Prolixibacteraceae bacterium]
MDLQTRKITFIQEFLKIQNESIIKSLEEMLEKKKLEDVDICKEPMSIYQFKKEIDDSMQDSKDGNLTKASTLKDKFLR